MAAIAILAAGAFDPGSAAQIRLATVTIETATPAASFNQPGRAESKMTPDLLSLAAGGNPQAPAPVIIQFDGPIGAEQRRVLADLGVRITAYIPDNAFLAEAPAGYLNAVAKLERVRWMGFLKPEYKISPSIFRPDSPARPVPLGPGPGATGGDAAEHTITITIRTITAEALEEVAEAVARAGGTVIASARGRRQGTIHAALRPDAVAHVAAHPRVEWIERYRRPKVLNNVAAGAGMMNADIVRDLHGLTGHGQVVGVCDTGLDTGDLAGLHPDFTNRVRAAFGLARPGEWSDLMGHGTHVCGSILGNGSAWSNGLFRGIAFEAELVIQSAGDASSHVFLPADLNDLFIQAYTNGARIHSDSWGDSVDGEYNVYCQQCDEFVWDHPDFLPFFSAGNSGTDADGDGVVDHGSIGAPGSAKNVMTVGAAISDRPAGSGGMSSSTWGQSWYDRFPMAPVRDALTDTPFDNLHQGMAAFSSRGPCRDGRVKPDIVAPGTDIISCRSRMPGASTLWGTGEGLLANGASNFYAFCGGTSMSTPLAAGAAALARQYLVENRGISSPSAALIKALVAAGARTLSPGQYGTGAAREIAAGQRPNSDEGWGHVNLGGTLFPGGGLTNILVEGPGLAAGGAYSFSYTPTSSNRVSIALAWSDYPASPLAASCLVNDLDLAIITPGHATLYPNGLQCPDRTNNLEMIDINPVQPGAYLVLVTAHNVPQGPQPFALVIHESAPETPALDKAWHEPAPVTNQTPVTIKAGFTAGSDSFAAVSAHHRSGGGAWLETAMNTENPGLDRAVYSAAIPQAVPGETVEYSIRAVTRSGAVISSATNRFMTWNGAIYVSPSGAAIPPYDSPAKGFPTIQQALDRAEPGMLILADAGVYGGETLVITQAVTLRSLHGPAVTILDGGDLRQCVSNSSLAVIDGFTIRRGRSGQAGGGGVFMHGGELRNCSIVSNISESNGGGLLIDARGTAMGCDFLGNAAGAGGGAACTYGGLLAGCAIRGNAARVYGGGAALILGGAMSNCHVEGNAALTNGGGVMMLNLFRMYSIRLNNCLVISNAAFVEGGGVVLGMGGSINNCTIADNASPSAGGLLVSAFGSVSNTIIYGNAYSNFAYYSYTPDSVQMINCCFTPMLQSDELVVRNQVAADPLFRHPDAGDYRLCANSPCRDAGTNAAWMNTAWDMEGNRRIINSVVDIGAYELPLPADMWNFAARRNAFADFDGDGRMDPAVYEPSSGSWDIMLSAQGYRVSSALFGAEQFAAVPGDYNGDRLTDMAVYDTTTGAWRLQAFGNAAAVLGGAGWRPAPGDYDGDGKTDPAVYGEHDGQWAALLSASGYRISSVSQGVAGCEPVFGDYDGDGRVDPAVYGRQDGAWSVLLSASGYAPAAIFFGGQDCAPAAADYDGDGRADPAIYEESTGAWRVLLSRSGYVLAGFMTGAPGCVPVPADYDCDGLADPALYQPGSGLWSVWISGGGYGMAFATLGGPGREAVNAAR